MKPTIVGMNHPSSSDPGDALELRTANAAGERLWKMALLVRPVSKSKFDGSFLKMNLSTNSQFPPPRSRVEEVRKFLEGRKAVILGRETWKALTGLAASDWFSEVGGWYLVPHPSGRCLLYNDENFRKRTGSLLVKLARWS